MQAPPQPWRRHYRIGYAALKATLLVAAVSLPDSFLHGSARVQAEARGSEHELELLLAALVILAATVSFYFVQGSDPGYLSPELVAAALDEVQDEDEDTLDADHDHQRLLSGATADLRESAKKQKYHLVRIQQIQAALEQESHHTSNPSERDEESISLHAKTASFCEQCALAPPLRAQHCKICGRCVAKFDHHCFVLGTCVGEKNHCRFWWFLLLQSFEVVLGLAIVHSSLRARTNRRDWLQDNALAIILASFFWLLLLFVAGLACFHSFLALANMTTHEIGQSDLERVPYLAGLQECDLPFSRGIIRNLTTFCLGQRSGCGSRATDSGWRPEQWRLPKRIDRDSPHVYQNLWENRYYSCC